MSKENDYGSESDTSDEDFRPDGLINGETSDHSEQSSDDESHEDINEEEETEQAKKLKFKKSSRKIKQNTTTKWNQSVISKCSTRRNKDPKVTTKLQNEKKDLEYDEDEKARSDALWADFLGDVKEIKATPVEKKKTPTTQFSENDDSLNSDASRCNSSPLNGVKNGDKTNDFNMSNQMTITETMNFAGEEVNVQKTIKADSIKKNKSTKLTINGSLSPRSLAVGGVKRPSISSGTACAGLGSILGQIGKKSKISVLEKTKLDWNSFKKDEGIEEELQTFNKGKDGFLDRQDFLERTDLRQFEIERNLRTKRHK